LVQRPTGLYKPLASNELRLLTVGKAYTNRADELVRVTLHHVKLEHTPDYKTWKETADPELRQQKLTQAWFAHASSQKAQARPILLRFTWGDYFALSYCWGEGGFTHRIILNGRIFPVTENLESALRAVRGEWDVTRLWVDALCINQNDVAERGREVPRMREIYGNAAAVFVSPLHYIWSFLRLRG